MGFFRRSEAESWTTRKRGKDGGGTTDCGARAKRYNKYLLLKCSGYDTTKSRTCVEVRQILLNPLLSNFHLTQLTPGGLLPSIARFRLSW